MVRINLLPVRVSKKKEAGRQQLVLFAVLLVLGLVGNYFWASSRAADLRTRQAKLARTKEDIAQLDRIIGEVKNLRNAQAELQQKLDVLDRLKQGRAGPVRMLDELATITPRQLWITRLEEKGGAISFTGAAVSIDDVSLFMGALKSSRFFDRVELKKTSASAADAKSGGPRLVNFEITAGAKYSPDAAPAAGAPKATAKGKG